MWGCAGLKRGQERFGCGTSLEQKGAKESDAKEGITLKRFHESKTDESTREAKTNEERMNLSTSIKRFHESEIDEATREAKTNEEPVNLTRFSNPFQNNPPKFAGILVFLFF